MRARLLMVALVGLAVTIGIAGCSGGDTVDAGTPAAPTSGAVDTDTPTPATDATPSGSASPSDAPSASIAPAVAAALSRFDAANQGVAAGGAPDDHGIVDALAGAGFDKSAMQITPDTTTIGRKVDSIEVSVRVGSTCLIGGFNGTTYTSDTAPVLDGGKCLLGTTRTIDW